MVVSLPNQCRVFDAADDPHRTLTLLTGFDINVAYRDVGQERKL